MQHCFYYSLAVLSLLVNKTNNGPKYKNSDKSKTYEIDEVYYYNILEGNDGIVQGATREKIINAVPIKDR